MRNTKLQTAALRFSKDFALRPANKGRMFTGG
jgi:hypothetical protein